MAALLGDHDPTVFHNYTQNFSNGHYYVLRGLFKDILVNSGRILKKVPDTFSTDAFEYEYRFTEYEYEEIRPEARPKKGT
jgi:hypothetical protein